MSKVESDVASDTRPVIINLSISIAVSFINKIKASSAKFTPVYECHSKGDGSYMMLRPVTMGYLWRYVGSIASGRLEL